MIHDIGQSQANEFIACISAGSIQVVGVIEGVTAFGGSAFFHDLLIALAVAGNRRIESGGRIGLEIDKGAEAALGGAVLFCGAFVVPEDIDGLAVTVGIIAPLSGRTGIEAFVTAVVDAFGAAGTAGFTARRCGGAQYGGVAGDNEVVEIGHQPFLDGRDDGHPDEEIFEELGQAGGSGLLGMGKEFIDQELGLGMAGVSLVLSG